MPARVYIFPIEKKEKLKEMLAYDPYLDPKLSKEDIEKLREDELANVIFARQDYELRDGGSINLDSSKCYLFLNAQEDFLRKAEIKLKSIEGMERAPPDLETKVSMFIENERKGVDEGFGSIFG
ncbi:MAG: hypothetical protein ACP5RT_01470 [Candidatus Micrarchaeia archaeon]